MTAAYPARRVSARGKSRRDSSGFDQEGKMKLRIYRPGDLEEIYQLFYDYRTFCQPGGLQPGAVRCLGAAADGPFPVGTIFGGARNLGCLGRGKDRGVRRFGAEWLSGSAVWCGKILSAKGLRPLCSTGWKRRLSAGMPRRIRGLHTAAFF